MRLVWDEPVRRREHTVRVDAADVVACIIHIV